MMLSQNHNGAACQIRGSQKPVMLKIYIQCDPARTHRVRGRYPSFLEKAFSLHFWTGTWYKYIHKKANRPLRYQTRASLTIPYSNSSRSFISCMFRDTQPTSSPFTYGAHDHAAHPLSPTSSTHCADSTSSPPQSSYTYACY